MNTPLVIRIYRKIVYTLKLWDLLPVAEYLTSNEKKVIDLKVMDSIDGWLTTKEAIALFRIAKKLRNRSRVIEIGTWKGKSTYVIATGLKSGRILCIDPFDATAKFDKLSEKTYKLKSKKNNNLFNLFKNNMKEAGVWNKIDFFKGYSWQYEGKKKIDFLFIDGDHSKKGCLIDFQKFSPFLKRGGYIGFHDYNITRKNFGVTRVVDTMVKENKNYKFVGLYDSLWVSKKIS